MVEKGTGMDGLRLGVWTPLPHTIPPEPRMDAAIDRLSTPGGVGGSDPSFEFACDVVSRAEKCGFSITLIAQRFLGPDLDCFMLASALAMRTRSIELLVAAHPGIIPPQVCAKLMASLDRISGGRAALNIVNGWWAEEFGLFSNGAALDGDGERYLRMKEYIEVMQSLLTGDTFNYSGRFYRSENGSLPLRPARGHIPFYAASRATEGKDIVANLCDLWFADYLPEYAAYQQNFARMKIDVAAIRAKAAQLGRKLSCGISAHVICTPNQQEAEKRVESLVAHGKRSRVAAVAAKALGAGLAGTPETVASRIRAYHDIGISCVMLHFHPMMEGLELFISEVLPRLEGIPIVADSARHS